MTIIPNLGSCNPGKHGTSTSSLLPAAAAALRFRRKSRVSHDARTRPHLNERMLLKIENGGPEKETNRLTAFLLASKMGSSGVAQNLLFHYFQYFCIWYSNWRKVAGVERSSAVQTICIAVDSSVWLLAILSMCITNNSGARLHTAIFNI